MTQMDSDLFIGTTASASSSSSSRNTTNNTTTTTTNDPAAPRLTQQYNWFYDKSELKKTPSILDKISYEKERLYRNDGARFILNVGSQMKLRYDTLATGVVYFHRFYMRHSFKTFPHYVTAACCLFLAGKAEETPKKCKDIIKIARTMLNDQQFATFGEDPREEVLTLERIVLQTIRFDLQVEHPYKYLVNYAKCFKGDQDSIRAVLQMAWTFTNDSLCTTICLQWEPEIVAIAMIFLASKIRYEIQDWEGRLPHHKFWWDMFVEDLSKELLEDICHQVLDLYVKPNEEPSRSPPPMPSSPQTRPVNANTTAATRPADNALTATNLAYIPNPPRVPTGQYPRIPPPVNVTANAQIQGHSSLMTASIPSTLPIPGAPPIPAHQWDPNMASYCPRNFFPIVGMNQAAALAAPVHLPVPPGMPPPPPMVPPIPIPTIPAALRAGQPIPPSFVHNVNQHR